MRTLRIFSAVLAASLAVPALAFADDLTVISKSTGPTGTDGVSTQYFSSSKFRTAGSKTDSIFDIGASKITVIDNQKKEYWESTLAEMSSLMQGASDQMQQAQDRAKNDPRLKNNPQAAAIMEKMMGGAAGGGAMPAAVVQKGPNPRKIAGYDCDHWIVSMDTMKMEIWTASAIVPPTQFWEARQALMASNTFTQRYAKMFDEMKKIKGFTLAETTTMSILGQTRTVSSEATEVKRGPIPESTFAVPAGYTKVESPMKNAAAKMKQPRG